MRGEDPPPCGSSVRGRGSPPHARGRRWSRPRTRRRPRITPACAGKTKTDGRTQHDASDHPRMRGEDGVHAELALLHNGSPPHARGRLPTGRAVRVAERITPACAGKTGIYDLPQLPVADHPRMRGEDKLRLSVGAERGGSPPHARGRRAGRDANRVVAGITPACAGKTCPRPGQAASMTDHPRMRGEDQLKAHIAKLKEGSPPHARGRQERSFRTRRALRITPACAGKTTSRRTA